MAVVAVILAIVARMFVTPTNKIDPAPPAVPPVESEPLT
jgi:hypothetical protein